MKVLFIHNALPEYRISFFQKLSELVDLDILVTDKGLATKVYGLSFKNNLSLKVNYLDKISGIKVTLLKKKYDLVVLPPVDTPFQWLCAWIAYKACKARKIKFVYWTEKWVPSKAQQPFGKLIKNYIQSFMIGFFAKKANHCIAAGSKSAQYLKNIGVRDKKVAIAYDSSTSPVVKEVTDIRKRYGIEPQKKIILYLGRIVERKGCDDLITAFCKVKHHNSNVTLLICGDGPQLTFCQDIAKQVDSKDIIFAGKIEPVDRAEYYKQSDVFVLPSYSLGGVIEAWGLTVNEALEQGTPVVATTAVGAAYDLADDKCCLMVEEHSVCKLADAIIDVLKSDGLKSLCQQRYLTFSVNNMAASFSQAFKETI